MARPRYLELKVPDAADDRGRLDRLACLGLIIPFRPD